MKYLTRLAALHNRESSASLASAPYGETNDQNDLHVGCADRGNRIFNAGHGCWQRCRGTARHDRGSYERYGLCAGTKRRRLCLGSLQGPALRAAHQILIQPLAGPELNRQSTKSGCANALLARLFLQPILRTIAKARQLLKSNLVGTPGRSPYFQVIEGMAWRNFSLAMPLLHRKE